MRIERARVGDAGEILELQKLAFLSEAELYDDYALPPLVQTQEEIEREFARSLVLKAVADGRIVGSVRGCVDEGTCHVARLVVHPAWQNRGLGTALMRVLEAEFPACRRFEIFTGHKSARTLHLYTKLGYTVFAERPVHERLTLLFLAKERQTGGSTADQDPAGSTAP